MKFLLTFDNVSQLRQLYYTLPNCFCPDPSSHPRDTKRMAPSGSAPRAMPEMRNCSAGAGCLHKSWHLPPDL